MDRTEFDGRDAIDIQSSAAVDGPASYDRCAPDVVVPALTSNGDHSVSDTRSNCVAAEPALHGSSPGPVVPAPTSFDGLGTRDNHLATAVDNGPAVVALSPTRQLPARTNTETVGLNGSVTPANHADEGRAVRTSTPMDILPAPKKRAARKAAVILSAPISEAQPKRGSRKQATARSHKSSPSPDIAQTASGGPAKKARDRKAVELTAPTRPAPPAAGLANQDGEQAIYGPTPVIATPNPVLAPIVLEIRVLHRQRQDLMRAETSLTLQIRANCRRLCGGDKDEAGAIYKAMCGKGQHDLAQVAEMASAPLLEAREVISRHKKSTEKRLDQLAGQLPIAQWVNGIRGMGIASLAAVIGETGDLSTYANPAKVWKRMGLAVIGDQRQRKIAGDAALLHGFSPTRRAIMWNIGASMLRSAGTYRPVYDARKAYELARGIPAGQAHARAKRYMEKRLLLHIWRAWNGMAVPEVTPYVALEDAA